MNLSASVTGLSIAKWAVTTVIGSGTKKIVTSIIEAHVDSEELSRKDSVGVELASWAITGLVVKHTKNYTDETIDKAVAGVTKTISFLKTSGALARINRGESTFDDEGLDPANFHKNDEGRWVRGAKEDVEEETVEVTPEQVPVLQSDEILPASAKLPA